MTEPGTRRRLDVGLEYTACSDEHLAAAFLDGDLAAFEVLVTRYSRPLINFAYRFLGNADDANDVAQLVFLQAYTHLGQVRLDLPLRPWLYQVARNKAIDHLRGRRQVVFSDLTPDADDLNPADIADDQPLPEALSEHADLQRILGDAIQQLAPKYRQVVAMRYTSDLTFREIGEALDLPENTVKTLFQRAKAQLRALLVEML